MSDNSEKNDSAGQRPVSLRILIEALRKDIGCEPDPDLVKQAFSDMNALDRQNLRNHFEARQEYARQVAELNRFAHRGVMEYGMQTLKWTFLLNAGAIAIVLTYVGGILGKEPSQASTVMATGLLKGIWPFVVGCICVALAGAASFFNFSYAEASQPSPEQLHQFLDPKSKIWPTARFQKPDETPEAFRKRFLWRPDVARKVAIGFALSSALFFVYGAYRVLRAALM